MHHGVALVRCVVRTCRCGRLQTYPLVGKGLPADALLARVRAIRPSLGASGAVVAVFAIVAARQPDRQARRGSAACDPVPLSSDASVKASSLQLTRLVVILTARHSAACSGCRSCDPLSL